MSAHFKKAVISGFIATVAMTMLILVAPLIGMPKMPIGNMLAKFMHIPVAIGWMLHFMIGIILAFNYITFFKERFTLNAFFKGMIFSLIPFLMAQIIVNPMMGAGLFAANTGAPMMMVMGSLIGHLVYGGVLGWTAE